MLRTDEFILTPRLQSILDELSLRPRLLQVGGNLQDFHISSFSQEERSQIYKALENYKIALGNDGPDFSELFMSVTPETPRNPQNIAEIKKFLGDLAQLSDNLEVLLKDENKQLPCFSKHWIFVSTIITVTNLFFACLAAYIATGGATYRTSTQPAQPGAFGSFVSLERCPPGMLAPNASTPIPSATPSFSLSPAPTAANDTTTAFDCPPNASGIILFAAMILVSFVPLLAGKFYCTPYKRPIDDLDEGTLNVIEKNNTAMKRQMTLLLLMNDQRLSEKAWLCLDLLAALNTTMIKQYFIGEQPKIYFDQSRSIQSYINSCKSLLNFFRTNFPELELPATSPIVERSCLPFFNSKKETNKEGERAGLLVESRGQRRGYGTTTLPVAHAATAADDNNFADDSKGKSGRRMKNASPPRPTMPMTTLQQQSAAPTVARTRSLG